MTERRNPTAKKDARAAIRGVSTVVEEAEEVRATFIVDKAQLKEMKLYAVQNDMLIKDAVREAFGEYLAKHANK